MPLQRTRRSTITWLWILLHCDIRSFRLFEQSSCLYMLISVDKSFLRDKGVLLLFSSLFLQKLAAVMCNMLCWPVFHCRSLMKQTSVGCWTGSRFTLVTASVKKQAHVKNKSHNWRCHYFQLSISCIVMGINKKQTKYNWFSLWKQ